MSRRSHLQLYQVEYLLRREPLPKNLTESIQESLASMLTITARNGTDCQPLLTVNHCNDADCQPLQ